MHLSNSRYVSDRSVCRHRRQRVMSEQVAPWRCTPRGTTGCAPSQATTSTFATRRSCSRVLAQDVLDYVDGFVTLSA